MSGDIPAFPSTLEYLQLGYPGFPGNHFTGSVRLNAPVFLFINENWITDVVIQDKSGLPTNNCDLSNNPLLGNPNIAWLIVCTKNGLYSAGLLPNTKSTSTVVTARFTTLSREMKVSIAYMTSLDLLFAKSTEVSRFTTAVTSTTVSESTIMTIAMVETIKLQITTSSKQNGARRPILKRTSTTESVKFVIQISLFTVGLEVMIRVFISWMIFAVVIFKTPFRKAFKRNIKKQKTRTDEQLL